MASQGAKMFRGLRIAVVSALGETRRAMRGYLEAVEAEVRTGATLAELAVVASGAAALVLFADDFPHGRVLAAVAALLAAGGPGVVLVSEDVEMAEGLSEGGLVAPRPRAGGAQTLEGIETARPDSLLVPAPPGRRRGRSAVVVAVPRPAWGWMVLDALRGLVFDEGSSEGGATES